MSSLVLPVLEGEPYLNFINSLKSKETKSRYRDILLRFLSHYQIPTLEDLLSLTRKDIEQMITTHITNMNARGLSHGYINLVMCAIFHFFDMNDVVLNKRKIAKFMGEHKKMNKDRAYTHPEIKLLVDSGDYRFRALVLLLASTGARLGSIPSLLYRHLERRGDVYKVTLYEGSSEEYYVFTTPESASAIDTYLNYRCRASETITPQSPLFRNDFNINSITTVRRNSKPITNATLKTIIHSRLIKTGIIERSVTKDKQRRHAVRLSHGFRKFWMTEAANAKINPEIREMLLNHKIGIASSYYRPTEEDMRLEAEKLIDKLTINPENRLKRELKATQSKQDEIALMKLEHQKEMKEMNERMDKMFSLIQENPKLAKVKKEILSEI